VREPNSFQKRSPSLRTLQEKRNYFLGAKHQFWVLLLAGTIIIVGSLVWNLTQENYGTLEDARIQARIAYEKDMLYRRWNAGHGTVYVPVTEKTRPDPYLSDLPERDIKTPCGRLLTLMHPTYMTRQAYELAEKESGVYGHITSLKPLRSENAPTLWETAALQAFERGEKEISSLEQIKGREYLSLIRPLIIEKPCLECHAKQGYREGQVRGGIRVSIPMAPLRAVQHSHILHFSIAHGLIWLLGLAGISFWTHRLRQSEKRRQWAEEEVRRQNEQLEHSVQERTAELEKANEQLLQDNLERKRAEEALRESEAQLQELLRQRLKVQETERRRICRELHDELGGGLAVFKLRLSSMAKGLHQDQGKLKEECGDTLKYLDGMIDNVYRISRDLSPYLLEDHGLSAALTWLTDHFRKNYNATVNVNIADIDLGSPRDDQIIIYRILQEALTNIGKHAQAKNVSVTVEKKEHALEVIVQDDGKGFNTASAGQEEKKEFGLGLRTIRERARLLKGSVDIWSREGQGTRVTLSIPVEEGIHHEKIGNSQIPHRAG